MKLLSNLLYFLIVIQDSISFSYTPQKVSIVVDFLKNSLPTLKAAEINSTDFPWHGGPASVASSDEPPLVQDEVAILKQENEDLSFICSGTLIQTKFVITAASCVVDLPPSKLKVGMGISLIHNPLQLDENPHLKLENVSEKYYPFHPDGVEQESDLAVLKLMRESVIKTPQLSTLLPRDFLSKYCFTLGWGAKLPESKLKNSCPKMNKDNALSILYPQTHQTQAFLGKFLPSFCSSLSLGTIFKNNLFNNFFSAKEANDGETCVINDFSHLKLVKVSSKAKYHYKYLCAEDFLLCISGWNSTDLADKVDVGSPIFCKIKKPILEHGSNKLYSTESQFGLAGMITNKQVERIPLLKYNSTLSVIRANNITHYAHFIFAVLKHNFN